MRCRGLLAVVACCAAAAPAAAQETKPLRWATDPTGGAPYVYQDAAGKFIGFEVELAAYLADKLGRTPVMKRGDWDKLPELLDKDIASADAVDIVLNGYEQREDLQTKYAATAPYFVYRLVAVTHKDNTALRTWDELATPADGKKRSVGVLNGSAAHEYTKDRFGDRMTWRLTRTWRPCSGSSARSG